MSFLSLLINSPGQGPESDITHKNVYTSIFHKHELCLAYNTITDKLSLSANIIEILRISFTLSFLCVVVAPFPYAIRDRNQTNSQAVLRLKYTDVWKETMERLCLSASVDAASALGILLEEPSQQKNENLNMRAVFPSRKERTQMKSSSGVIRSRRCSNSQAAYCYLLVTLAACSLRKRTYEPETKPFHNNSSSVSREFFNTSLPDKSTHSIQSWLCLVFASQGVFPWIHYLKIPYLWPFSSHILFFHNSRGKFTVFCMIKITFFCIL